MDCCDFYTFIEIQICFSDLENYFLGQVVLQKEQ